MTKLSVAKKILILISVLFSCTTLFSQNTISIQGPVNVDPGAEIYYEASFQLAPEPQSIITWFVQNGTIIDQSTTPGGVVYCVIRWDNTNGISGEISIYEDLYSQWGGKTVQIGNTLNHCGSTGNSSVNLVCGGSVVIGNQYGPEFTYSWTPAVGLSNPTIAQPTASPTQTTTYRCIATPIELIQNGDFENGYANIQSDYLVHPSSTSGSGPGRYLIASNSTVMDPSWCSTAGRGGSGSFMIIDGANNISQRFYYTQLNVVPN